MQLFPIRRPLMLVATLLWAASASAATPDTSVSVSPAPVTLHMLGDSTMTAYKEERRPQMGWGEKLPAFLTPNVTVINWALGGRSSRSFYYEESRWPAIRPQIKSGDYVLIQFGHNDQKNGGAYERYGTYAFCSDGSNNGEDCKDVEHSYYQFLKRYVLESRAQGGFPILMSPIARKYFEGDTISIKGQHNLTKANSGETYPRGDYVAAVRALASKYDVPFVDLTAETRQIVEQYGNAAATRSLYIAADNTHPQVLFATLIARRAADGMRNLGVLRTAIIDTPIIIASPDKLNWGTRYVGDSNIRPVALEALALSPAKGSVKLTAPAGYALSLDQKNWADKLAIDYANSKFTQTLYVRFSPNAIAHFAAPIRFESSTGALIAQIDLAGDGVKPGSGIDTSVLWPMTGSLQASVDGPVKAADAAITGLKAAEPVVLAVDGQDATVTRYTVGNTERQNGQYLQYAITPSSGTLHVSALSAYLGALGTAGMQADVEYSLNDDFSHTTRLTAESAISLGKDEIALKKFETDIQLAAGQTLYIRIFPWNTAGGTGKSLAIYNLKLSGRAMP